MLSWLIRNILVRKAVKMAELRDYIKVKHGFAFKGDHITTNDNGIVLVTPGNFSISGGFKEEKCKFFDGEYPTDYVLRPGDLIVTMTDLSKAIDTLGYSALVPKSERTYLHNQRIGLVKIIDEKRLDKHYLYWFMRTSYYQKTIAATSSGSTVHHTSPDRIMDVEIELPDLEKQRAVATFMDNIESKINTNKQINKNLEQQAQAIYRSWFVNYEPFDGTKPDDWSDGTIDALGTEIICGKTPSTKKSEYYGGNTPFITIPDMHGCVYIVSTERYLSDAGVASQPKKTLPPNTVCVSCIGTAGLVTLVSEESQSNQQINSIIPKEGISVYYIYLLMQTLAETINKLGQSGSTIVNLNKTQFGKIQVMIPSKRVLQDFDSLCRPLFDTILSNQKENINLSELRDTLLPKFMSGELDVSDIDL